jgi:hypothetical protein
MSLQIYFENSKITIPLQIPVKIRDLLNVLSKKLGKLDKNFNLINPDIGSCYDENEFLQPKDNLEILMVEINPIKNKIEIKSIPIEEAIKECTGAKDSIKSTSKDFERKTFGSYYNSKYSSNAYNNYYDKENKSKEKEKENDSSSEKVENSYSGYYDYYKNKTNTYASILDQLKSSEHTDNVAKTEILNSMMSLMKEKKDNVESSNSTQGKYTSTSDYYKPSYYKKPEPVKPIEPDVNKLNELLFMGFDETRCKKALIVSNNNIEQATELILGGSDFELYDQLNTNNTKSYADPYYGKYGNYGGYGNYGKNSYIIDKVVDAKLDQDHDLAQEDLEQENYDNEIESIKKIEKQLENK